MKVPSFDVLIYIIIAKNYKCFFQVPFIMYDLVWEIINEEKYFRNLLVYTVVPTESYSTEYLLGHALHG